MITASASPLTFFGCNTFRCSPVLSLFSLLTSLSSLAAIRLSAYACIKTSATQLPKPTSCVLTNSDLASNGVSEKQTGLERVEDTLDNSDLSNSSISGEEGEEGRT
jgi:hypothetical protein